MSIINTNESKIHLNVYQRFKSKITEYIPGKTCIEIVKSLIPVHVNNKYNFSKVDLDKLISEGKINIDKDWFNINRLCYNCICTVDLGNNFLFKTEYKKGKIIIIGTVCKHHIAEYLKSINIEAKNLINIKCRGCDKYEIKQKEHLITINNYYCKNCRHIKKKVYYVKYKCGHNDVFDVNNNKICIICRKRQEIISKENFKKTLEQLKDRNNKIKKANKLKKEKLWISRLNKYKKLGKYKRCVDCRKIKQIDHHTKCNSCKYRLLEEKQERERIILEQKKEIEKLILQEKEKKEWTDYMDNAILTGVYSRCVECKKNKKADKWKNCWDCKKGDLNKCKCGKYKYKTSLYCYICKQLQ